MPATNLPQNRVTLESGDEVRVFLTSPLPTNTYAWISGGECLVVDPGSDGDLLAQELADVKVTHVVATHGHNDHASGVGELVSATGADFARAEADVDWVLAHAGRPDHWGRAYGSPCPRPDRLLAEGDTVSVGTAVFTVYAAPGHTPGGIVLLGGGSAEGYCFVGDSIFEGSHGRTDLEGGDAAAMDATLHRLAGIIPGDTVLLCGHGNATTMAREIATTPFYR
ncbi:MAG: MBL fold metallo-hydrolase [Olegusella sp.]|nr:MBL fold metallo-hydrolase [Olegusella sp.]